MRGRPHDDRCTSAVTTKPRRSLGGSLVESSLEFFGFSTSAPHLAIVETSAPRWRGYDVVLVQNAWNVISATLFKEMLEPYSPPMRRRMWARRALAHYNITRAGKVICLTEYMTDLCSVRTTAQCTTVPVHAPPDVTRFTTRNRQETSGDATKILIPGTVTWYKNPAAGIEYARALRSERGRPSEVLLAGPDDGSGCLASMQTVARRYKLPLTNEVLNRNEMLQKLIEADVVCLGSRLESLGFSMAEALLLSPRVVASSIPTHKEISLRLGREPSWDFSPLAPYDSSPSPLLDSETLRFRTDHEWIQLGHVLGLGRHLETTERQIS